MADTPFVFVSIPHGGAAGNVLRAGLLGRLLGAREQPEVVVLSPMVKDAAFIREFERPRVRFEDLPPHRPEGLEGRLMALVQAGYLESGITESVRIRRQEALSKGTIRWMGAKKRLASWVMPSMVRPRSRYQFVDRMISHPWADAMFEKYHPTLLVTSSPGLIFSEVPLLRTAVRRGVRSMAVDPSWDNFTNKLLPVRRVNRLVVWNDLMKQQAVDLHGYEPDEIRVAGTPQWDAYFSDRTIMPRDAFFREIGADPARRLITLTTTPRELYPHHDHVLRVLVRAMSAGAWHEPVQILVRLHPRDELASYAEFAGLPNVIVEKPFRSTIKSGDGLAVDFTSESQRHLANTLRYSDVVINVASTIAIEAAIYDTPVVNLSFDGEQRSEFAASARRYYRFTHYVNITRHHAVRVAEQPSQLVELVGRYLDDPSLDRDGRRRVVLEQCQFVDGRAAERVARFVVEELADVCGSPLSPSCAESLASSR